MKVKKNETFFPEEDGDLTVTDSKRVHLITADLLMRLRDGDPDAFQQIYLQSIDSMREFLFLLLHSREDAEDLAQEIFVRLWERREYIDPTTNFRAYLYRLTKWVAFDALDHRKVEKKYENFAQHVCAQLAPSPEDQLMTEEMALMIRVCLEKMPPKQKMVFELSRFEGKSNEEIAKILHISPSTVRVHLSTAKAHLKDLITGFLILFITQ